MEWESRERDFTVMLRVNGRHPFPVPLEDLCRYLDRCFELRSQPRVSELALEHGMTIGRLSRLFQEAFRASLSDVMKTAQIALSKQLLTGTELSVDEIACRAAFTSPRAFFRLFKHVTGRTPQQYRMGVQRGEIAAPSNGSGFPRDDAPTLELRLEPGRRE